MKNNCKTTVSNCGFKNISLKPQLQAVVLQFPLKSQLVTVVLQLFLIHVCFNGIVILILFLKYFLSK